MSNEKAYKISPRIIVAWVCFLLVSVNLPGLQAQTQDKATLTAERTRIEEQLITTSRLIDEAKNNRHAASSQLALLDKQIELRERLIRHHQSTIRTLERSVIGTDSEIRTLEGHIEVLKEEYARMIQQAYRIQLASNPLMFVFAAEDFSQAALRFRMLQSYAEVRKSQAEEITSSQNDLSSSRKALTKERASVVEALNDSKSERNALQNDRSNRSNLISDLKREERRLRKTQKSQEKERKRLNDEIKRIIEAEIAAERASAAGEYALTPAGRIVSEAFEKNRQTLPWPVTRGVITEKFGRHNHPTIPGITIESNGVDIATDAGSSVFTVFAGTVSSVFSLPGAGNTVIITHGGYRTVYSNLESIKVSKGDRIERGEKIGLVTTQPKGSILHFEVWKVQGSERSPQNPKSWLQPL